MEDGNSAGLPCSGFRVSGGFRFGCARPISHARRQECNGVLVGEKMCLPPLRRRAFKLASIGGSQMLRLGVSRRGLGLRESIFAFSQLMDSPRRSPMHPRPAVHSDTGNSGPRAFRSVRVPRPLRCVFRCLPPRLAKTSMAAMPPRTPRPRMEYHPHTRTLDTNCARCRFA